MLESLILFKRLIMSCFGETGRKDTDTCTECGQKKYHEVCYNPNCPINYIEKDITELSLEEIYRKLRREVK